MTQWGMLLLCGYIVLGVGRSSWRVAGRLALLLTVIVIAGAMFGYLHSGTPVPFSHLAGTSQVGAASGTTEDTTGRTQELSLSPQPTGTTPQTGSASGGSGS